jgi:hypothetical protein
MADFAFNDSVVGEAASAKTLNSVGTALQGAHRLPGPTGQDLATARHAFIHGSNAAALVGAAVAAAAALMASRFLPAGMRVGAPAPAAKPTITEQAAGGPIPAQVIQLT